MPCLLRALSVSCQSYASYETLQLKIWTSAVATWNHTRRPEIHGFVYVQMTPAIVIVTNLWLCTSLTSCNAIPLFQLWMHSLCQKNTITLVQLRPPAIPGWCSMKRWPLQLQMHAFDSHLKYIVPFLLNIVLSSDFWNDAPLSIYHISILIARKRPGCKLNPFLCACHASHFSAYCCCDIPLYFRKNGNETAAWELSLLENTLLFCIPLPTPWPPNKIYNY